MIDVILFTVENYYVYLVFLYWIVSKAIYIHKLRKIDTRIKTKLDVIRKLLDD